MDAPRNVTQNRRCTTHTSFLDVRLIAYNKSPNNNNNNNNNNNAAVAERERHTHHAGLQG